MSPYAIAVKNLYLAHKISYEQLENAYTKGLITREEMYKIISLAQ